jgi:hypothetical protein
MDCDLTERTAANRSRRLPRLIASPRQEEPFLYMKKDTAPKTGKSEPMGIVISRGDRSDPPPVFVAFVWGPAPELGPIPQDTRAA